MKGAWAVMVATAAMMGSSASAQAEGLESTPWEICAVSEAGPTQPAAATQTRTDENGDVVFTVTSSPGRTGFSADGPAVTFEKISTDGGFVARVQPAPRLFQVRPDADGLIQQLAVELKRAHRELQDNPRRLDTWRALEATFTFGAIHIRQQHDAQFIRDLRSAIGKTGRKQLTDHAMATAGLSQQQADAALDALLTGGLSTLLIRGAGMARSATAILAAQGPMPRVQYGKGDCERLENEADAACAVAAIACAVAIIVPTPATAMTCAIAEMACAVMVLFKVWACA